MLSLSFHRQFLSLLSGPISKDKLKNCGDPYLKHEGIDNHNIDIWKSKLSNLKTNLT